MRRGVKKVSDHNLINESQLLNLSVYEFYFHLESLKASQVKT